MNPKNKKSHKEKKVVAIVQARMGSSRLRGKSLSSVNGIPLIKRVITTLRAMNIIDKIILATTNLEEDEPLVQYSSVSLDCNVYRGHSQDVFSRFFEISQDLNENDIIVRVTADNIFYDNVLCRELVEIHNKGSYDYTGINGLSHRAIEVVSASVFKLNSFENLSEYEKEHVTPHFINNPKKYNIKLIDPTTYGLVQKYDAKLTIDTENDRDRVERLLLTLQKNNLEINQANLYGWLTKNT